MIKIIKEAPKEYIMTCKRCGCQFSYELVDVSRAGIIKCPNCNNADVHILDENIDELVDMSKYDNKSNNTNSSVFTKGCHNCIYRENINNVCEGCIMNGESTPSRWEHNITVMNQAEYPPGSCITCKNIGCLFTQKPCKDCYNGDRWEKKEN